MADEVIAIKIIQDENSVGATKSSTPSTGGSGNLVSGMGGMFKTVLSGLGIASIVGIVAKILSINKGLMSVVGGIIKMVGYLLKPITDVIMILLYPILLILKPIMLMVNQIMRPFIRQAMLVMKEGASQISGGNIGGGLATIAGGVSIMTSGLQVVINALLAGLIKGVISSVLQLSGMLLATLFGLIIDIFSPILSMLGVETEGLKTFVFDTIMSGATWISAQVNSAVDSVFGSLSAVATGNAAFISELFGLDSTEFQKDAVSMLKNVFIDASDSISNSWGTLVGTTAGFGKIANITLKQTLYASEDSLANNFGSGMDKMKEYGSGKISSAVDAFNSEFDKLKNAKADVKESKSILQQVIDLAIAPAPKIKLF